MHASPQLNFLVPTYTEYFWMPVPTIERWTHVFGFLWFSRNNLVYSWRSWSKNMRASGVCKDQAGMFGSTWGHPDEIGMVLCRQNGQKWFYTPRTFGVGSCVRDTMDRRVAGKCGAGQQTRKHVCMTNETSKRIQGIHVRPAWCQHPINEIIYQLRAIGELSHNTEVSISVLAPIHGSKSKRTNSNRSSTRYSDEDWDVYAQQKRRFFVIARHWKGDPRDAQIC